MALPLIAGATLGACLSHVATQSPDSVTVFPSANEIVTAAELAQASTGAAHALRAAGVRCDDVVGVLVPPGTRLVTTLFGAWRAGAAVCVLPVPTGSGADAAATGRLARFARAAAIRHVVVSPHHRGIREMLRHLAPDLTVVTPYAGGPVPAGDLSPVDPDSVAVVQSGVDDLGAAWTVPLSHRAVVAALTACVVSGGFGPGDVAVQWVPVFTSLGLTGLLSQLLNGSELHVFSPTAFLRRPAAVLEHFAAVGGSVLSGPNSSYDYLLDAVAADRLAQLDLSRWRLAINGSEPVSATTVERFTTALAPAGVRASVMFPVYGFTTAGLPIAYPRPGARPRILTVDRNRLAGNGSVRVLAADAAGGQRIVSVGRAVHGLDVRIVGPDGTHLTAGTLGGIEIAGPAVPVPDGRWMPTGDVGFQCGGDLFVTERCADPAALAPTARLR
jgi:fatty-acyl-CoA synthase